MAGAILTGLASRPSKGLRARYPDVRFTATFYTHSGSVFTTKIAASESRTGRPTDDLVACQTHKTISSPAGTYSLTLVPRQNWIRLIAPGDWCELQVDNNDGGGYRTLMYGPISEVRQRRTTDAKGNVNKVVSVSGSDFGKVFLGTANIYDPTLADEVGLQEATLAKITTELQGKPGTSGEMINAIISRFLTDDLNQWVDPKTGKIFGGDSAATRRDTLTRDYIDTETLGKAMLSLGFSLSGSLWQLLQQWSNPAVNELFVDYRPPRNDPLNRIDVVPAIILRRYPFWGGTWRNLTSVEVDRSEVIADDLGRTDADVRNWIRVIDEPRLTGSRSGIVIFTGKVGVFNAESIKKFGFRRFENPSLYVYDTDAAARGEQPRSIDGVAETFTGYQTLWHHSNELLFAGSMTTYCRPEIRVGYRLDYSDIEDGPMEYYVEGVQHAFSYPARSTTSLTVTRGRSPNDKRFTDGLSTLERDGVIAPLGQTLTKAAKFITGG